MTPTHEGEAFRERYGSWALVAGGSDGIGAAFARELARRGLNVALVARRAEPLEQTAAELRAAFGVEARTISADLTDPSMAVAIERATVDLDVGLFVYNAGASQVMAKFLDQPLAGALALHALNGRGPLMLAHYFGTRFRERGRGGIVLMSSLACLAGGAYTAVYSASKAFVTTLCEALWHELAPEGIDVLGVLAGKTKTESMAHSGAGFDDAMAPDEVATGALDHLGHGPLWVPGEANQAVARGMWPVPRVPVINAMSQATAELFGLPHTAAAGREFHDKQRTSEGTIRT